MLSRLHRHRICPLLQCAIEIRGIEKLPNGSRPSNLNAAPDTVACEVPARCYHPGPSRRTNKSLSKGGKMANITSLAAAFFEACERAKDGKLAAPIAYQMQL